MWLFIIISVLLVSYSYYDIWSFKKKLMKDLREDLKKDKEDLDKLLDDLDSFDPGKRL
jgi:hypothetical protein